MLPYWLLFILPACAALAARPVSLRNIDGTIRARIDISWVIVIVCLSCLIGFRYEVGGDWFTYLFHFSLNEEYDWASVFTHRELGYVVINKTISELGLNMTSVNLVCGAIFSIGLVIFLRVQPRPWLALVIAIPYLIIVVAMGYTRQATALGFAFIALTELRRSNFIKFCFWVIIGAMFHNSAVLLIPIAGLTAQRNRLRVLSLTFLIGYLVFEFVVADRIMHLWNIYVTRDLVESSGTFIRLAMNFIAAIVFIIFRKKFDMTDVEKKLWLLISLASISLILIFFATDLSTVLDRIALYFLPIQIVAFSHLPDALGSQGKNNNGIVFLIISFFAIVQFVWLNFASHSSYWLPYKIGIIS